LPLQLISFGARFLDGRDILHTSFSVCFLDSLNILENFSSRAIYLLLVLCRDCATSMRILREFMVWESALHLLFAVAVVVMVGGIKEDIVAGHDKVHG
jgi:hypothetical protein